MSIFVGYLRPKPSLLKNFSGTVEHTAEVDKYFIVFPGILNRKGT